MMRTSVIKTVLLAGALSAASWGVAASFTSQDNAFTLDMPAGWKTVANPPQDSVLTISKGDSRITVKTSDCRNETCLENKINNDLAEIKRKNMQVVGNAYTGEEIKRIEFSTGEPFFYISFYSPKNDFGAGYFLISGKSYSILARNLTYAETDLIFSFISPRTVVEPTPELIEPTEITIPDVLTVSDVPIVMADEQIQTPLSQTAVKRHNPLQQVGRKVLAVLKRIKHVAGKLRVNTLISPHMPPYIRQLGHGFDVLIWLAICYVCLFWGTWAVRPFFQKVTDWPPINPNSLYPIRFKRLYGTPSLIFRAKDNQGNVLTALASRWDSLFMFLGLVLLVCTGVLLALTAVSEIGHLLPLSAFVYNTIYAVCSLLIPLGIVVFFCGVIWSQLVLKEINLFDNKGKRAAIILQKGFGLTKERYQIYFARSKEVLTVTRKRYSLRRSWQVFDADKQLLADIRENSAWRAIVRKLFGHLWGFLRADYTIKG
ncbi:MAG: hypothetical protein MJ053_04550, partial [Elusimicrobiaceae bacterium]|nr:hypothetical protein [Elusimicrobiaceae bacterium]